MKMSRAAISIFVFGVYLLLNGIVMMAAPNALLATLNQPPTQEPWLRVFGAVVFVLALYYIAAARQEVVPFFRFTIWGRPLVMLLLLILTVAGVIPPIMVMFAVIDTAGAVWTALALRSTPA